DGNHEGDNGDDEDNGEGQGPAVEPGECPAPGFVIDFAGLPAGTIMADQYASRGVTIGGIANRDFPSAVVLFDSNAPPTHDPDLHVNLGNIALLPLNLTDRSRDGLEVIDYRESGALTGIEVNCQPGPSGSPTPTPTRTPSPGASATPTAAATSSPGPCPPNGFVLNFSGLPAGTILGEQFASLGVH